MGAIIALLPTIIAGITQGVDAIRKIRAAAKQTGEWTDEQEQQFQTLLTTLNDQRQWQPDDAAGNRPR